MKRKRQSANAPGVSRAYGPVSSGIFPACRRIACVFLFLFNVRQLEAGKVTLRITAANKDESRPRDVQVNVSLPQRIGTNDIINLGGLELGYDVNMGTYFVFKEQKLEPKEIKVFSVELQDVWTIGPENIEGLTKRASDLVGMLGGTEDVQQAEGLRKEIEKSLDLIKSHQGSKTVGPGTSVAEHIRAYEVNLITLRRVKEAVGALENMVLGAGKDPGPLVGEVKEAPAPSRRVDLESDQYKTILYKIVATNTSPDETRSVPISKELPAEIKVDDILDAAGLTVETARDTGIVRVYTNGLSLKPNEARTYIVRIRDKWNVNTFRMDSLKVSASNTLEKIGVGGKYVSVQEMLTGLIAELDAMQNEPPPVTLNPQYVAFFRAQQKRLDVIEQKINRINAALRAKMPKMGFDAPPPNPKTTWMIIYGIIGFLFLMSVLFFFRWYGGTKVDSMTDDGQKKD